MFAFISLLSAGGADSSGAENLARLKAAAQSQPKSETAAMAVCRALVEEQKWPDALEAARAVLKLNPSHAEAMGELGWCLMKTNQDQQAFATCEQAVRVNPNQLSAWLRMAQILGMSGNYAGAEVALKHGYAIDPTDPLLLARHACLNAWRSRSAEDIAVLRAAVDRQPPDEAGLRNELGALLMKEKPVEAFAEFQKVLNLRPRLALAWSNLGIMLESMGDTENYFLACQRTLEIDPEHQKTRIEFAGFLLRRGHVAEAAKVIEGGNVNLGDPDKLLVAGIGPQEGTLFGLEAAKEALARDPGGMGRHLRVAGYYDSMNNSADALKETEEELRKHPGSAAAWSAKGALLFKLQRYPEAIGVLREASRITPSPAGALSNLAVALDLSGEKKEAEIFFKKSIEAATKAKVGWDHQMPLEVVWAKYAVFLGSQSRYQEALAMAAEAYRRAPGNTNVLDTYIVALSDAGQWQEALKLRMKKQDR